MSKENWRERTKRIIEAYPQLKRELNELQAAKVTPNYNGMPGSQEAGRTTEGTALRTLPAESQRMLDAVEKAIATTGRYRNSHHRLRIVDLVYWKKTHNLQGAAIKFHYSYDTVQEWNADFIELVDAYMRIP